MAARKRFLLPTTIGLLLVVLLGLIGWLAFRFFDMVAQRALQAEPMLPVTTAGVQRVAQRGPVSQHDMLLPEQPPPSGLRAQQGEQAADATGDRQPASGEGLIPIVCTGYPQAIRARKAWPNPLQVNAAAARDQVVVRILPPRENAP